MKLTRKLIKRLIKEETQRLLSEASWSDETGSDLLDFAKAYASLGGAVQEQIDSIVSAYFHHGFKSQEFQEAAYEVNPAAVEMAIGRMGRAIRYLATDEAEDIMTVLETAQKIYVEGDEEVASDKAAADAHPAPESAAAERTPEAITTQYKEDSWGWQRVRNEFYNMSEGNDNDGVRQEYYPGWSNQDFIDVIVGVDGNYEEYE